MLDWYIFFGTIRACYSKDYYIDWLSLGFTAQSTLLTVNSAGIRARQFYHRGGNSVFNRARQY